MIDNNNNKLKNERAIPVQVNPSPE